MQAEFLTCDAFFVRNAFMNEFGEALRSAMAAEQMTLASVGDSLGLSHTSIARWIKGSLPDDAALVGRCAACFPAPWSATLVRAYLLDRCPVEFHHLLSSDMHLRDAAAGSSLTPLERAIESIRAAANRNGEMRALVLDLGRIAEGL